jgi:hypothetical protein
MKLIRSPLDGQSSTTTPSRMVTHPDHIEDIPTKELS